MKYLKKILFTILTMVFVTVAFTGCGQNDFSSDFVIGKSRVHTETSTITVETPFELIANGKLSDAAPKAQTVNAEGHNNNLQILVTGNPISTEYSKSVLTEKALNLMKSNPNLKNLKSATDLVKVGSVEANALTFDFVDSSRGKDVHLILKEYIFEDKNTVWRVIYQYRADDEAGKYLFTKLSGKITLGATF